MYYGNSWFIAPFGDGNYLFVGKKLEKIFSEQEMETFLGAHPGYIKGGSSLYEALESYGDSMPASEFGLKMEKVPEGDFFVSSSYKNGSVVVRLIIQKTNGIYKVGYPCFGIWYPTLDASEFFMNAPLSLEWEHLDSTNITKNDFFDYALKVNLFMLDGLGDPIIK